MILYQTNFIIAYMIKLQVQQTEATCQQILSMLQKKPLSNIKGVCRLLLKWQNKHHHIPEQFKSIVSRLFQINSQIYQDQHPMIQYLIKNLKWTDKHLCVVNKNCQNILTTKRKIQFISKIMAKTLNSIPNDSQQFIIDNQNLQGNQVILSSQGCLGCIQQKYDTFVYPFTGQCFLSFQFKQYQTFKVSLLQSFCAILNAGEGYIFIKVVNSGFTQEWYDWFNTHISSIIYSNQSWSSCQFYIDFVLSMKNPFLEYSSSLFFDVRVLIKSQNTKKLYYIECQQLGTYQNEICIAQLLNDASSFCIRKLNLIKFYNFALENFRIKNKPSQICINQLCARIYAEKQKKLTSEYLIDQDIDDNPKYVYKESLLVLVPKNQASKIISWVCEVLKNCSIKFEYIAPFNEYNKKCPRRVYFMSLDSNFDTINNLLKQRNKKNEYTFVLINPTKYLQIPCEMTNEKQSKVIKELQKQLQKSKCIDKIEHQQYRDGPLPYVPNKTKKTPIKHCESLYLTFENSQPAIHCFIILYSLSSSVKGYFIKQIDF